MRLEPQPKREEKGKSEKREGEMGRQRYVAVRERAAGPAGRAEPGGSDRARRGRKSSREEESRMERRKGRRAPRHHGHKLTSWPC